MKYDLLRFGSPILTCLAFVHFGPAYAAPAGQDTAQPQPPAVELAVSAPNVDNGAVGDDIVVTGSLIRNPNLVVSSPINALSADQVELRQAVNAEQLLREMPGVVPSIGFSYNLGNQGASLINLRGMGDNRNLVLLDGARGTPGDLQGRFDLNNIPLALIERVDILTGGASTTYGADAISGVINFVTRRRFTGVQLDATNKIAERGDGGTFRVDLTGGMDFAGGRGNVLLSGGYQSADPVFQSQRRFSSMPIDSSNGRASGSTWTAPSTFSLPALGTQQVRDGAFVPLYAPFNTNTQSLLSTGFERYNGFGAMNYEISDAVEFYTRGMYSNNRVETIAAPAGASNAQVVIPISNPYLSDAQRTQLCSANGISATACLAAATVYDPASPAYRQVTSVMSRRSSEFGVRRLTYVTEYYDLRAGVRGTLAEAIDWDISGGYGRSVNQGDVYGVYRASRIARSFLAGRDAEGNIVCRDRSDGCVPADWFGPIGSLTPAMNGYLSGDYSQRNTVSLLQVSGKVSGSTGWATPFATTPLSFAMGGEYRRYRASQVPDVLAASPDVSGGNGPIPFIRGAFNVYEGVAELVAPLIEGRPLVKSLTLEGGIRFSSYKVDAPNDPAFDTTTWKVGGNWEPVGGLRLRATYAHAVRAPNINELFGPQRTTIQFLADDPCASLNDQGASIGRPIPTGALRAVCIAQGAPAGQIGFIQQPTLGQANVTTGGNLNARPETSDSVTIGMVLRPAALPRFNLSVDYYNIKVDGAISTPTTGDAAGACFANPDPTSSACLAIRRNPVTGSLMGAPDLVGGLFLGLSNLGRLRTDGIDVSLNYAFDLGAASWAIAASGNWTRSSEFQATPTSPVRECVGVYGVNCVSLLPEFQWSVRNTLTLGDADISLMWRHIDAMRSITPAYSGPVAVLGGNYDFSRIAAYDYFDLTLRLKVTPNVTMTAIVENLFDRQPPVVGGTVGPFGFNSGNTFPSSYDAIGRRFGVTGQISF